LTSRPRRWFAACTRHGKGHGDNESEDDDVRLVRRLKIADRSALDRTERADDASRCAVGGHSVDGLDRRQTHMSSSHGICMRVKTGTSMYELRYINIDGKCVKHQTCFPVVGTQSREYFPI